MQTLIDPFELTGTYFPPPARAPMPTLSVDIDFEVERRFELERYPARGSTPDEARDSWARVRCWCSED